MRGDRVGDDGVAGSEGGRWLAWCCGLSGADTWHLAHAWWAGVDVHEVEPREEVRGWKR